MTIQSRIIAAPESQRAYTEMVKARAVKSAAKAYADALWQDNKFTDRTEYARLKLCNAIIDLFDDGDALAVREIIMNELSIDEDGNPARDDVAQVERLSPAIYGGCRS